jgi:hypothetical protein
VSAVIDPDQRIKAGDDRVNTAPYALIRAELDSPAAAEDGKAPGVSPVISPATLIARSTTCGGPILNQDADAGAEGLLRMRPDRSGFAQDSLLEEAVSSEPPESM